MHEDTLASISGAAKKKIELLRESRLKYLMSAGLAGLFIGFGIMLIFVIAGLMAGNPASKIVMGVAFPVALSLVVALGTELFTGNNMVGMVGFLNKAITGKDLIEMWVSSYIGGALFFYSGVASQPIAAAIVKGSVGKITAPAGQLFFRGILCNFLVCLAVLAGIKLKEETAKLIMVFWCLFVFITAGFEHSVANMTLLTIGALIDGTKVTLSGFAYNLSFVTLGNIVGGSFIGFAYYFIGKEKNRKNRKNEINQFRLISFLDGK